MEHRLNTEMGSKTVSTIKMSFSGVAVEPILLQFSLPVRVPSMAKMNYFELILKTGRVGDRRSEYGVEMRRSGIVLKEFAGALPIL